MARRLPVIRIVSLLLSLMDAPTVVPPFNDVVTAVINLADFLPSGTSHSLINYGLHASGKSVSHSHGVKVIFQRPSHPAFSSPVRSCYRIALEKGMHHVLSRAFKYLQHRFCTCSYIPGSHTDHSRTCLYQSKTDSYSPVPDSGELVLLRPPQAGARFSWPLVTGVLGLLTWYCTEGFPSYFSPSKAGRICDEWRNMSA